MSTPPPPKLSETVAQLFNLKGLVAWWNASDITQAFGHNGEEGDDYGLGNFGVPVGSITWGKVVYVGDGGFPGSSIGQIVQVLNTDGSLLHYQHLKTSNVKAGDSVSPGTVVGSGGGCPIGCYGTNPSCTCYDQYSSGQHIEVRYSPTYNASKGVWSQNWVNPQNIFIKLAGLDAGGADASPVSSGSPADTSGAPVPIIGNLSGFAVKAGVFLFALAFVGFGVYLLFKPQIDAKLAQGGKLAKTLAKVALL